MRPARLGEATVSAELESPYGAIRLSPDEWMDGTGYDRMRAWATHRGISPRCTGLQTIRGRELHGFEEESRVDSRPLVTRPLGARPRSGGRPPEDLSDD